MVCPDFQEEHCTLLSKPPYVCNGCKKLNQCVLTKYFYRAQLANQEYLKKISESRSGLSYTEGELVYMDEILTPLVKRKQSIHHILVTHADSIPCSERTVYKLIEQGVLTIRNIDLPRKVRYRPRRPGRPYKVDRTCREGRTWQDFQKYMEEHPDATVVQLDSVEGCKGGKVMLTVFLTQSGLMLMYLRNRNTSQSVIDIFNTLDETLGRDTFRLLFPVCLADNGSEFSNPRAIEYDSSGQQRTRLFYCNPSSPYQKPEIERNHEFIRMVLPKGRSFDGLTQDDVDLLACHINSLTRKKLNDRSPLTTFNFFHGDLSLQKLGLRAIPPDDVTLSPELLAASREVNKHEEDL
jgi:IS30 family transposase